MKMLLVICASIFVTGGLITNAYIVKKQFYPMVVYITKSNSSMALIYAQAFGIVIILNKLFQKLFFGRLRPIEFEHLMERSWYAITETCLMFTSFRDDLSPKFIALFTILLFLRSFHWLTEDRVDFMERSPVISLLFHVRIASLIIFLTILDAYFLNLAYDSTVTKGPSVQLVFGFEYAILLTAVLSISIKYALYLIDSTIVRRESPWQSKAICLMYIELLMSLMKVILYIIFITMFMRVQNFPLFAIRPMYLSIRAFRKALNDVILSRRAIRNMNSLYPDASVEDLANTDNVCIICREEMIGGNGTAKKLPCNHIFHVSCLSSWFLRQQTCPTCRLDVFQLNNSNNGGVASPAASNVQRNVAQGVAPAAGAAGQPAQAASLSIRQVYVSLQNMSRFLQQQRVLAQQRADNGGSNSSNANPVATGVSSSAVESSVNVPPSSSASGSQQTSRRTLNEASAVLNQLGNQLSPLIGTIHHQTIPNELSKLTLKELRQLEESERRAIELKLEILKEIRSMIDNTINKMQQYQQIFALTEFGVEQSKTSQQPQASTSSDAIPSADIKTEPKLEASTSSSSETKLRATDAAPTEEEEIRRKRIAYLKNLKVKSEPSTSTDAPVEAKTPK